MIVEETYDVIDRQGNKIRTATWKEVHSKGLLHQNVHGILFQDSSLTKTLIKKRADTVVQEAGKYEIAAAGHVFSGEKPEKSIEREVNEELFGGKGLPNDLIIKKIGSFFNNDFHNNNEIVTLFSIIHSGPFAIQVEEAEQILWMDWRELVKDMQINSGKYAQYSINAVQTYLKIYPLKTS